MPAELILLPNWLPVNIYEFSSWARSTIVPLLILMDRRPVHEPPSGAEIPELFPDGPDGTDYSIKRPAKTIGWESFFYAADLVLRMVERLPVNPALGDERTMAWLQEYSKDVIGLTADERRTRFDANFPEPGSYSRLDDIANLSTLRYLLMQP